MISEFNLKNKKSCCFYKIIVCLMFSSFILGSNCLSIVSAGEKQETPRKVSFRLPAIYNDFTFTEKQIALISKAQERIFTRDVAAEEESLKESVKKAKNANHHNKSIFQNARKRLKAYVEKTQNVLAAYVYGNVLTPKQRKTINAFKKKKK